MFRARSFYGFYMFSMKLSSRYSLVDVSDLIFQKCSEPDSFLRFLCEIELSLQSCALFVDGNRVPTLATTDGHVTRKKHRVSRPAGESFQGCIHAFPTCYTSQLRDDDVLDMMMWLT